MDRRPCAGRMILRMCFAAIISLAAVIPQLPAQVSVTTANGDNYRTNSNLKETQLTPRSVRPGQFGKLWSLPADGQVYAQPLYATNVTFPNGTTHDVVLVTTMHNSVYAYDAAVPSAAGLLWQVNLGPSFPVSLWNASYTDVSPEAGILGTGVIDPVAGVLYVAAETLQNGAAAFYLHALDLVTGAERMNGPVVISAGEAGSGAGSFSGQLLFNPNQHLQRPGLLLANNAVYVGFGSHMDQSPWHGWIMSYSASDLTQQLGIFLTTPNGEGGAVWHSGRGIAVDDSGDIYAMTGNGDFDENNDYGESYLKLSGAQMTLADFYTPTDWQTLSDIDADLSTGVALIPGTHNLVGGDKYGQLYFVNGDSMGGLGTGSSPTPQVFTGAVIGGMFNFALWNQYQTSYIYVQGEDDVVKSYVITDGGINTTPASQGSTEVDEPRVGMTVSANGSKNGILWETTGNFNDPSTPGTLHAYDASNLAVELWNSDMNAQDTLGGLSKFANPTVVNGKVYVGTASAGVVVYGLFCPGSLRLQSPACSTVTTAAAASGTQSPQHQQ